MKTTLFFDLDDTLWNTIGNAKVCLQELFIEHGVGKYYSTFDDFYKVYSQNTTSLWEKYSKGSIDKQTIIRERFRYPFAQFATPTDTSPIDDLATRMNADFFARITTKTELIEGAIDLLDYLKPKYAMHIISNGFSELQYKKINGSGLGNYFDKIILSDAVGVNKPHPRIFEHLLAEAKVMPDEVMMIGDNVAADIAGAQGVGIDQIWFNPTNEHAKNIQPTYTVASLEEIKQIL